MGVGVLGINASPLVHVECKRFFVKSIAEVLTADGEAFLG